MLPARPSGDVEFTRDGLDQALVLIDKALGIVGDNEWLYAAKVLGPIAYVNAWIRGRRRGIEQAEACASKVA